MINVLRIAAFVLNLGGALFGLVYIILNLFMDLDEYGDFNDKNRNACFVLIAAGILTLVVAFCACLFALEEEPIDVGAIYALIALTWLALIMLCGCAMIFLIISSTAYSTQKVKGVRTVFFVALGMVVISLTLVFLL